MIDEAVCPSGGGCGIHQTHAPLFFEDTEGFVREIWTNFLWMTLTHKCIIFSLRNLIPLTFQLFWNPFLQPKLNGTVKRK
jgi:hypothetical protein